MANQWADQDHPRLIKMGHMCAATVTEEIMLTSSLIMKNEMMKKKKREGTEVIV